MGSRRLRATRLEPLEKPVDRDADSHGDFIKPAGGDAVETPLLFVRLLVGDAYRMGQLLLRYAEHGPAFADGQTDMAVHRGRTPRGLDVARYRNGIVELEFVHCRRCCSTAASPQREMGVIRFVSMVFTEVRRRALPL